MINLGTEKNLDQPVMLDHNKLTTHTVAVGMTGSGKSGLLLGMTEELAKQGTAVVLIDIKGDMANIALQAQDHMSVRLITPGARHGDQVNLFAGINKPELIDHAVSGLLKMAGVKDRDPLKSTPHAFLSSIMHFYAQHNVDISLAQLIVAIQEPPFDNLGAMELNNVISYKQRMKLASQINNILVAPSFELWREGDALDFNRLFASPDGKVPVVIYSVNHLIDDDERNFAIANFMDELLHWSRKLSGTDELRLSVVIDECFGLVPPHPRNPATKRPILTLMKQARAFGVNITLATQNPMDIDYKAMNNAGTWLVGRLQTEPDRKRVVDGICSSGPYNREQINFKIAKLKEREFLLVRPGKIITFKTRTVDCELRGPMSPNALTDAKDAGLIVPLP